MTRKRGGRRRGSKRGAKARQGKKQAPSPPQGPPCCKLLTDLPAPVMRQLVQQHLGSDDCVALLGTCHQLARVVVQHRTQPESKALHWTWRALDESDDTDANTTATPEVATAARLLVDWAPAELHVTLQGTDAHPYGDPSTALSLPPALPPLITNLTLEMMHLGPSAMEELQRCQRLRALHVQGFTCDEEPELPRSGAGAGGQAASLRARIEQAIKRAGREPLRALPLLRELSFYLEPPYEASAWVVHNICTLCARATKVGGFTLLQPLEDLQGGDGGDTDGAASSGRGGGGSDGCYFPDVADWDLDADLDDLALSVLRRLPSLRRVQADAVTCKGGHDQPCPGWETLTVAFLDSLTQLRGVPPGVRHVVVAWGLHCLRHHVTAAAHEEELALLPQWGPDRLRFEVDSPPSEYAAERWQLEGEEREAGFFSVHTKTGVAGNVRLLQGTVLPPGGGPRTLQLEVIGGVAGVVRQLAPLLARTRVRTLCMEVNSLYDSAPEVRPWVGVLGALPASVACVRVRLRDLPPHHRAVERAGDVLVGEAVRHPVRLVMLFEPMPSRREQEVLRALCRYQHPLVRLETVEAPR